VIRCCCAIGVRAALGVTLLAVAGFIASEFLDMNLAEW
jgi:hypothetical protein